ncbi:MAG: XisI protein [Symploca sp. SIO3E6]|nr:XisI protein [Caldora sp. SIO3E6]
MERIDYRDLIEKIIQQHATANNIYDTAIDRIVFDRNRDSYLLLYVGWHDEERIYGVSIHIEIIDGKIWIQQDFTEEGIANQLVELGVPKTDIVLGFRAPVVRKFTEFSVA